MEFRIALIRGDGIGPEIVTQAVKVLDKIGDICNHSFIYEELLMGGISIDTYGEPLTDDTLKRARDCNCILLGAVGGNPDTGNWYKLPVDKRPEAGLLKIRKELGLYANIRPAFLFKDLIDLSPIKKSMISDGFDMVIVRELTGGLYFGNRKTEIIDGKRTALDSLVYTEDEIERITRKAFEIAMLRRKKLVSVDKANVLDSSRLWRKVVNEVSKDFKEVSLSHMLVDNCAMQLINSPTEFDVILTENMFGDILSDEAAMITGSLGMLPSASLGNGNFGLYEPCHGSAYDIANKDLANPVATILSVALLLKHSLNLTFEANLITEATKEVLKEYRTKDIMSEGKILVGCNLFGDMVVKEIEKRGV